MLFVSIGGAQSLVSESHLLTYQKAEKISHSQYGTSMRRYWLPQLVALAVLALLGTVPFWLTDLDLRMQEPFYQAGLDEPWPGAEEPLWSFLYQAAPMITGLVVLGGLLFIAAGLHWGRFRRFRAHALFVMAVAILGPGLIVNGVLKEQVGRPRPHQVEVFGGTKEYLPPLKVGEERGMSFPSGHASVGFMLAAFFLIWLRDCPLRAWTILGGALAFGSLLGFGRMVAGDHFLSDIIWSAVIVYGLALVLYYFVFRIPQREDSAGETDKPVTELKHPVLTAAGYAITTVAMVVGVLLATPVHQNRDTIVNIGDYDPMPRTLRLVADYADVFLYWHDDPNRPLAHFKLRARGFGLPGNRVESKLELEDGVLSYEMNHNGLYTERDTQLVVPVVYTEWDRIIVRTGVGDIQYAVNSRELPAFDLQTSAGKLEEYGMRPK